MGLTGKDFIKNETPLGLAEYPAVVISMNRYKDGFADEIMKRAFLIYTHTALAVYNDKVREDEDQRIRKVTDRLTGHLYRRYLQMILDKLDEDDQLRDDWLLLSSSVLSDLIRGRHRRNRSSVGCAPVTYPPRRAALQEPASQVLTTCYRPTAQIDADSPKPEGWWIDSDTGRIVVRERVNQYGRERLQLGPGARPPSSTPTPPAAATPRSCSANSTNSYPTGTLATQHQHRHPRPKRQRTGRDAAASGSGVDTSHDPSRTS